MECRKNGQMLFSTGNRGKKMAFNVEKNTFRSIFIFFTFAVIFFLAGHPISASEPEFSQNYHLPQNFHEYTLENSMKIFVLEDFSCVPVRIELSVRAGFSAQTPKTAGFFPLYAQLFAKNALAACTVNLENSEDARKFGWFDAIQESCNADSANFTITVSPEQVEKTLEILSAGLFSPIITDKNLAKEFASLKEQVTKNAFSTAGFINAGIDSRIFSQEPWKQDSGIYPELFTNTSAEECRTILTNIARNYYTPQNSAIFISGGISAEKALEISKKYFHKMPVSSAGILSDSKVALKTSQQKKYVLHDPLFADEMSQIVIQYKNLAMEQSDAAAAIFNEDDSRLKNKLVQQKELSIRDKAYINVASAHKNGSSRLIFQSLLEKNPKSSPAKQAELFLKTIKEAAVFSEEEKLNARQKLISQFLMRFKNSQAFMEMLSQFWAITNVSQMHSENTSQELILQPRIINEIDFQQLEDLYADEQPFVFLLVNSEIFKKNAGEFKKAGYEEITVKNGSWYSQKLYDKLKNSLSTEKSSVQKKNPSENENIFLQQKKCFEEENSRQFSSFRLSNNIPVIMKKNPNAATSLISLAVSGGQLSTAKTRHGLAEILTNSLAHNIQLEISKKMNEKAIKGSPEVLAETNLAGGIITVECLGIDAKACIESISTAIIYGNITPALADGLIYDKRSRHRIQRAGSEYQLFCSGIKILYQNTDIPLVYSLDDDILKNTQFMEILSEYPALLDAAKYSLVLTGNIPEHVQPILESNFGILANQTQNKFRLFHEFPKPDFSVSAKGKSVHKIKIEHKFLADTSTPVGKRPLVLIPTTDFSDPVQYWIESPAPSDADFVIFNAILYELEARLDSALKADKDFSQTEVFVYPATAEIQAGIITFSKVKHTDKIDKLYANVIHEALNSEQEEDLAVKIKNRWILKELSKTQTNRGTALLMRQGLEAGNFSDKLQSLKSEEDSAKADTDIHAAQRYIKEYEIIAGADNKDFFRVAEKYFPEEAALRLYSADSKK